MESLKKVSKLLKEKIDVTIVLASAFSTVILFIIAYNTRGILHDFSINLSASMLAIAITVLLVDKLREHRVNEQYKIPSGYAMQKIKGSNSTLALTLAAKNHKSNPQIVQGMMANVSGNDADPDVMITSSIDALRQLAQLDAGVILETFSYQTLETSLLSGLQHVRDSYVDIQSKYGFSFREVELKSDFADLLESVDMAIGSLTVIGVGEVEMNKLFKPVDPSDPGGPMTIHRFIGISLIAYLKKYVSFIDKYSDSKD